MPAAGVRAWLQLRSGKPFPPKPRLYVGMMALQVLSLFMALLPRSPDILGLFRLKPMPVWVPLTAAAYLVLIAVRIRTGWPQLSEKRKQRARLVLPEDKSELRYWVVISILAGICEEYAYRGVAYAALAEITGSPVISVVLCVLAFGLAHIVQGWRGVLGASALALLFHFMVFITQSLYLAIAFHILYDLVVGFFGMRALMRDALTKAAGAQLVS